MQLTMSVAKDLPLSSFQWFASTDVFIGWPGSVNDALVFCNSPLFQAIISSFTKWYIPAS